TISYPYSLFGGSVALSGDGSTLLIGAPQMKSAAGVVYVFPSFWGGWYQSAMLLAADGVSGDEFGFAVTLSNAGSTALIGAPDRNHNAGAGYVFLHSGSTWTQQPDLTASDGTMGAYFGVSVALNSNGSTALIGADGTNNNVGAAYIFVPFFGSWNQ